MEEMIEINEVKLALVWLQCSAATRIFVYSLVLTIFRGGCVFKLLWKD